MWPRVATVHANSHRDERDALGTWLHVAINQERQPQH